MIQFRTGSLDYLHPDFTIILTSCLKFVKVLFTKLNSEVIDRMVVPRYAKFVKLTFQEVYLKLKILRCADLWLDKT